MPTTPLGDHRPRPSRPGLVPLSAAVWRHLQETPDGGQLISVRHQPQGPVSYLFEPDDELTVKAMDLDAGHLVVHAEHVRWGELYVLCNGPAVTEVCLHTDIDQAADYRQRSAQLADEYMDAFRLAGLDLSPEQSPEPGSGDE